MASLERTPAAATEAIKIAFRCYLVLIAGDKGSRDTKIDLETTQLQIYRSYDTDQTRVENVESILLGIAGDIADQAQIAGMQVQRSGGYIDMLENERATTLKVTIPLTTEDFRTLFGRSLVEFINQCTVALDKSQLNNPRRTPNPVSSDTLRIWGEQLASLMTNITNGSLEVNMSEWIGPHVQFDCIRVSTRLEIRPIVNV